MIVEAVEGVEAVEPVEGIEGIELCRDFENDMILNCFPR
jgi:hypothetical protein